MKKIVIFLFIFTHSTFSQELTPQLLFPMQKGNKWLYVTYFSCEKDKQYYSFREVTDTITIDGSKGFYFKDTKITSNIYCSSNYLSLNKFLKYSNDNSSILPDGISIGTLTNYSYNSLYFGRINVYHRNIHDGIQKMGSFYVPNIGYFGDYFADLSPCPDNTECVRCVIDSERKGPPFSIRPRMLNPIEISRSASETVITIFFDSIIDSTEFLNNVSFTRGISVETGFSDIKNLLKVSLYTKDDLSNDTLKIFISAQLKDKLGFQFDGNKNGYWEGSPADNLTISITQNNVNFIKPPIDQKHLDFHLYQNYPNPFNPTTTIRYTIQEKEKVFLSICDILGREIEILVNELQTAGAHTCSWNAKQYSSGIYFYKLKTDKRLEVKKMILTR